MNKHQQSGMTTLLITSMLLIVALLFSLASYKNLFYQIKRTQNEVLARQAHWAAEGGLECGFTEYKIKKNNFTDFDECNTTELMLKLTPVTSTEFQLESKVTDLLSSKIINKKIKLSPASYGAIQSRSDLKLLGGIVIAPDVIDRFQNGKYKCISVRYSSRVQVFGDLEVGDPIGTLLSYPDILLGGKCAEGYNTKSKNIDTSITPPSFIGPIKKDFEHEPHLDPFEDFFGKKRSEILSVKAEFEPVIGSVAISTNADRCATRINKAFAISNKVWVSGDCDLHGDALGTDSSIINKAKILVFENGIVGASGSVIYNGAIYHLIDEPNFYDVSLIPKWNNMPSHIFYKTLLDDNSVFFSNGSFLPTGGIIFDTPGGTTTYNSSLNLTYDRSFNPYTPKYEAQWQQGSWHDF